MSEKPSTERICRGCDHEIPWDWVFCAWCGEENDRIQLSPSQTAAHTVLTFCFATVTNGTHGSKVTIGYSTLEQAQSAHRWLMEQQRESQETESDMSGPDHPRQHDTMDIESPAGTKVQYMDCNGYPGDVEHCRRAGLVKDQVYEVVEVDVFDAHSNVRLKGFDGLRFNTVCFCSAQNTGDTR